MMGAVTSSSSVSSPVDVVRIASIEHIDRAKWEALTVGAQLYQHYAWLSFAEVYYQLPTRYIVALDRDGTLLGAVVTYLMRDVPERQTTWYDPVRLFLSPHGEARDAASRWFPVLLIGGCSGYHSELLFAPALDATGRRAVLRALASGCAQLAAEQGAGSVAFLYAPRSAAETVGEALGEALGAPARLVPTSAEAVIELGPEAVDFEGYLSGFPSARRSKLRREAAAFAQSGARVGEHTLAEVLDRVIPLLGGHQRKYGDPITDEQIGRYLTLQQEHLGALSTVFTDERDGRINGFTLCYSHGDTFYARAAGFDAEHAAPYAYFNLAVYEPIRHAIAHGQSAVCLGAGSFQAKLLRGANNRLLWSAVVPPQPLEPAWDTALGLPSPQAVEAGYP
jgi:uncharacterized protein